MICATVSLIFASAWAVTRSDVQGGFGVAAFMFVILESSLTAVREMLRRDTAVPQRPTQSVPSSS